MRTQPNVGLRHFISTMDGRNEFGGRAFRTGLASLRAGEEPTVFAIDEGLVELQQRGGFENNGKCRDRLLINN